MEKIKAALAKVKSNKAHSSKPEQVIKHTPRNINKSVSRDIGHIDYTNTKVIELNAKHLEENRIVSHLTHNAVAGIFDSLRTQVLQKMTENNWQTIAVVSPTPESGKSLVSINLAMSIARLPQKTVALVDFDFRKPRVAQYLGIHVDKSINDYLEGNAKLEDVLVNPSIQHMVVLPTMKPVEGSSEVMVSSKVSALIDELTERYESRVIIFDVPPLLNVADTVALMPQVDCILMVIANGVSTQEEIEEALQLLPREKVLGFVYNKADAENKNYYY